MKRFAKRGAAMLLAMVLTLGCTASLAENLENTAVLPTITPVTFPEGIHHIGDMLKAQLSKAILYFCRGQVFAPNTQYRGGAAHHITDQFQNFLRIVIGVLHCQQRVIDLLPHGFPNTFRVGWIDRWISITEVSIDIIIIICVRFSDVLTAGFRRS